MGGGYIIDNQGFALLLIAQKSAIQDYKFFCFNGVPKFLYVSDSINHKLTFFHTDWTPCDFGRDDFTPFNELPKKPSCLSDMLSIASILSRGIPHVRIDLYYLNKKIYFGESTFYTGGGFIPFQPKDVDFSLGKLISL